MDLPDPWCWFWALTSWLTWDTSPCPASCYRPRIPAVSFLRPRPSPRWTRWSLRQRQPLRSMVCRWNFIQTMFAIANASSRTSLLIPFRWIRVRKTKAAWPFITSALVTTSSTSVSISVGIVRRHLPSRPIRLMENVFHCLDLAVASGHGRADAKLLSPGHCLVDGENIHGAWGLKHFPRLDHWSSLINRLATSWVLILFDSKNLEKITEMGPGGGIFTVVWGRKQFYTQLYADTCNVNVYCNTIFNMRSIYNPAFLPQCHHVPPSLRSHILSTLITWGSPVTACKSATGQAEEHSKMVPPILSL